MGMMDECKAMNAYGYKTQADFVEAGYGDQKLKRGRWQICFHEDDEFHDLWHQCEKECWDMYDSEYMTNVPHDTSYTGLRKIKPNWHCQNCFAVPPASIVTVWCLLEPDYTSEAVQEAILYQAELDEEPMYPKADPLHMQEWVYNTNSMRMYDVLNR